MRVPLNQLAPVFKIDAHGNLEGNKTFASSSAYSWVNQVLATKDGGYAVIGSLDGSVWLAKFAPESASPNADDSHEFPTVWIAVPAIIATIAGIGLFVFLKKRRQVVHVNKP